MTMYQYPDYLYHFGVKGMKWGVRKTNKKYTSSRQKQDERLYGKQATKRVNKRLNKGETLVSARHSEVVRRDKKIARKKKLKNAVETGASIVGIAGAMVAADIVYYDAQTTKALIKVVKELL